MLLALRPLLSARKPWVPWKKYSAHEVPAMPHAPTLPSQLLHPLPCKPGWPWCFRHTQYLLPLLPVYG